MGEPIRESFNIRFRDEFLNNELFTSVQEAKMLAEQHRIEGHLQNSVSVPGKYAPGDTAPVESGLSTHHSNWISKKGHVSFA